ncbi:MAG: helix-hairpin-helix domain-containing protein [Cyclobacteriaceae bacterium]
MKYLGIFILFSPITLLAQSEALNIERFIENIFQIQSEDLNYEDAYEVLYQYHARPLDLNRASKNELASLYLLSPRQINAIIDHRERYGKLVSLYELQAIPEIDRHTFDMLSHFVKVNEMADSRPLGQRIIESDNKYLITRINHRLQKSKGIENEIYSGGPTAYYSRFRMSNPGDFSFGATLETDMGESLAWNPQTRGFDYQSAHMQLQNQGVLDNLVIGDFRAQFGQGLVFGSGFSPGKGAETINTVMKGTGGVRPHTSAMESGHFRGIATTVSKKQLTFTMIGSALKQDGSFGSDTTISDQEDYLSSLLTSGLHRTEREISNKNILTESSFGLISTFSPKRNFSITGTYLGSNFSTPYLRKLNDYNLYEFRGSRNHVGSLSLSWNWQNYMFFGESARSVSGGMAHTYGVIASLSPSIDIAMVGRSYDRDYHSFYGNGFGEGSRTINETGIYWGIKFSPAREHLVTAYYDRFSFPWLKYRIDAPSRGSEYLVRYSYLPSRNVSLYIQFRQENKQRSIAEGNHSVLSATCKRNIWLNVNYGINEQIGLRSRLQLSDFALDQSKTTGMAIIQDLNLKWQKWKLSSRIALFDSDDYENRHYITEKDVLYGFAIPALSGTGTRYYSVLQYALSRKITIWAKYSRFRYRNVTSVGSGNDTTPGNIRSDLRLQARLKF